MYDCEVTAMLDNFIAVNHLCCQAGLLFLHCQFNQRTLQEYDDLFMLLCLMISGIGLLMLVTTVACYDQRK